MINPLIRRRIVVVCKKLPRLLRLAGPSLCAVTDWLTYHWQTNGGYGLQGKGRGRGNREREVVWFSPFCQQPSQQGNLPL